MKKASLLIIFAILIILLSIIVRFYFDFDLVIALIVLSIEILLTVGFILRFKTLSERFFKRSIGISVLLIFISLIFFFITVLQFLVGDCTHNYCYKGTISSNYKVTDSIEVHLKGVGDIIFSHKDFDPIEHVEKIAIKDSINISGHYFCSCGIDINAVNRIDSFPIVLKKDSIMYVMYMKRNDVNIKKENGIIIIDLKKIKIN